jgi:hypothetical protein
MNRDQSPFDPELEALLERARTILPAPDVVRARALARARAAVAAATASAAASTAAPVIPARGRTPRIALAASVALLIGAASAGAALRGWIPQHQEPAPQPSPRTVRPVPAAPEHPAPPAVARETTSIAKLQRPARQPTAQESYAAELELLQRAQAAYTRRDFSSALVLVAEHGRRFPNGRLAEQREALRVRSFAGSGRAEEARRAVAAFAVRFPRSVLLQRLQETATAAQ